MGPGALAFQITYQRDRTMMRSGLISVEFTTVDTIVGSTGSACVCSFLVPHDPVAPSRGVGRQ